MIIPVYLALLRQPEKKYVQFCISLYKKVKNTKMIKDHVWEEAKEADVIQLKEKAKDLSTAVFNYLTGV